jgi:HAD superfamily hydrolase (TIGR01509 family)
MAIGVSAVLFDVDGTLVESVDLHAEAWREALRRFGKDVPLADVRRQIGKGGDELVKEFLSKQERERDGEALEAYRAELWRREFMRRVTPLAGARELVLRVQRDGKRAVLASSGKKDEVEHNRKLLGLDGELDGETSADDAERSKPHPDIFEAALAEARVRPEEAIAIGDSPWDAIAAKRAGLRTIGVLSGGFPENDLREAGCIAIYRGPQELLERYEASPLATALPSR